MFIELQASCVGSVAAKAMSSNGLLGTVTDSFENSFYLRTIEDHLLFFTSGSIRSPVTINLKMDSRLGQSVRVNQLIESRNGELRSRSMIIHTDDAKRYDQPSVYTRAEPPLPSQSTRILAVSSLIMQIVDTTNSTLDPAGFANRRIRRLIRSGILPMRTISTTDKFREHASGVIGLGFGFTPSGDDFLGGFLGTYNTFSPRIDYPRIILGFRTLTTKTSWISAKLIDYMQSQILDEQVGGVVQAAARLDETEFILGLQSLLARGHTSGIDIVTGIILAVSLTFDILTRMNLTEKVAAKLNLL